MASNFIQKSKIPIVVKADGLAAGKGVLICNSKEEAIIESLMCFKRAGASAIVTYFALEITKNL